MDELERYHRNLLDRWPASTGGPQSTDPMYEPDKALRRVAGFLKRAGLYEEVDTLDEIRTVLASTVR